MFRIKSSQVMLKSSQSFFLLSKSDSSHGHNRMSQCREYQASQNSKAEVNIERVNQNRVNQAVIIKYQIYDYELVGINLNRSRIIKWPR
jgi:hypothetical protein